MKRIKHVIVKKLATGYYKLTPKQGYLITDGHNTFTYVISKYVDGWFAVQE